MKERIVVYQVFTRLFGNKNNFQKPWGTIQENGVGKFSDFTIKALEQIKDMGVTHIWYTGVIRHALYSDMYVSEGIKSDDARIVKGRAGSPYAIKDYYDVNPDLAENPALRMQEFEQLVSRTHCVGLKVIIDIVPNHLARNYHSVVKPEGVRDFGQDDNTSVEYDVNNNFYYIPGHKFCFPDIPYFMRELVQEQELLLKTPTIYKENPARWTGNGARRFKPDFTDWYETVKLNFGVSPDGDKNFPLLDNSFRYKGYECHYDFWKEKQVPSTWQKLKDVALYWLSKGVDGFRYDMAELVPVEFWSYLNSCIMKVYPQAFLLAEIYNPDMYRDYIQIGKMGYLYDKVGMYDTLRGIIQYEASTDALTSVVVSLSDISSNMLSFLENHDEQRIASFLFANNPEKAKPAMVFLSTVRSAPTMIYFGQEVGEPAQEKAGFGSPSRTSIFDYIGVTYHQRWMNGGKFDGGGLTCSEKHLRDFYKRVLRLCLEGDFIEIHDHNRRYTEFYNDKVYSFMRNSEQKKWIVICNFSSTNAYGFDIQIPWYVIEKCGLTQGSVVCKDILYNGSNVLRVEQGIARMRVDINPLQSFVYQLC